MRDERCETVKLTQGAGNSFYLLVLHKCFYPPFSERLLNVISLKTELFFSLYFCNTEFSRTVESKKKNHGESINSNTIKPMN